MENILPITNISLEDKEIKDDSHLNLIRKVKSKYIIENIFSFLEEKIELKMIIYNKNIQNLLGINIDNYKIINRK